MARFERESSAGHRRERERSAVESGRLAGPLISLPTCFEWGFIGLSSPSFYVWQSSGRVARFERQSSACASEMDWWRRDGGVWAVVRRKLSTMDHRLDYPLHHHRRWKRFRDGKRMSASRVGEAERGFCGVQTGSSASFRAGWGEGKFSRPAAEVTSLPSRHPSRHPTRHQSHESVKWTSPSFFLAMVTFLSFSLEFASCHSDRLLNLVVYIVFPCCSIVKWKCLINLFF